MNLLDKTQKMKTYEKRNDLNFDKQKRLQSFPMDKTREIKNLTTCKSIQDNAQNHYG